MAAPEPRADSEAQLARILMTGKLAGTGSLKFDAADATAALAGIEVAGLTGEA